MSNKKGFTLIELLIVMVIIGILVKIALPVYFTMMQQGAANAAEHNLITIYNAQQGYSLANNGVYCTATTGSPANCGTQANLSTNLGNVNQSNQSLNITDNYFNYACAMNAGTPQCTATSVSTPVVLTVTLTSPIVLPGGSSALNPLCTPAGNTNCPSD